MTIVKISNFTKNFGTTTAVHRLSLDIQQGEIFGLVGPDGAGKTTAIRLMLGILTPDFGDGKIGDYDLRRNAQSVSTLTGYVSQRFSLYPELTVRENLELFADIYAVPDRERTPRLQRLMQFSRLEPFRDRLARNLSGGMKQKLALSCALIHTPKVLFLDEPTTGVDPLSRRDLWRLLFDLWQEGVTIVVSTPYMDEAERCSRVGFLSQGRLIALGAPEQLRQKFRGAIFEVFSEDKFEARSVVERLPFVTDVNVFGAGLHITVAPSATLTAAEQIRSAFESANHPVTTIERIDPSMEDVFFQITGGAANAKRNGNGAVKYHR
jgi:ABC-2 type transport system ATP-binding protein